MGDNLIKVELGCGNKKTDGYIGVDRFPLPCVDIVADLNKRLPFEDNSVDVVWACHSLEHLDDLYFTMSEIYRICKNKAILHVLSPYHNTSLNIANFYHKSVFNEETFRFFSKYSKGYINAEEYYRPNAANWGLSQSDNSSSIIEMSLLNIDFFYYDEYFNLSEDEKRRARKAFSNVCDQLYYTVAINKQEDSFFEEEIENLKSIAKETEPKIIESLRKRIPQKENIISVYDDISKISMKCLEKETQFQKIRNEEFSENIIELENKLQSQGENLEIVQNRLQSQGENLEIVQNRLQSQGENLEIVQNRLQSQGENLDTVQKKLQLQAGNLATIEKKIKEENKILQQQIKQLAIEKNNLSAITLELLNKKENSKLKKYSIFKIKNNMFDSLKVLHPNYMEGIVNKCPQYGKKAILALSNTVPFANCATYRVDMNGGNTIHYFLFACIGSSLIVEAVQANKILKQEFVKVTYEGEYSLKLSDCNGIVFLRLRTIDNYSIVRVLEVQSRKKILFIKKDIAYFVTK